MQLEQSTSRPPRWSDELEITQNNARLIASHAFVVSTFQPFKPRISFNIGCVSFPVETDLDCALVKPLRPIADWPTESAEAINGYIARASMLSVFVIGEVCQNEGKIARTHGADLEIELYLYSPPIHRGSTHKLATSWATAWHRKHLQEHDMPIDKLQIRVIESGSPVVLSR